MSGSDRWPLVLGGVLALLVAGWLLRRRMPAEHLDEAAAVAGRILQHGQDIGPRPGSGP